MFPVERPATWSPAVPVLWPLLRAGAQGRAAPCLAGTEVEVTWLLLAVVGALVGSMPLPGAGTVFGAITGSRLGVEVEELLEGKGKDARGAAGPWPWPQRRRRDTSAP